MKVNVFGKKMELKTEAVVITSAILILLGCLAGYIFFRDDSDIIIENGTPPVMNGNTSGTALQSTENEPLTTGEAIAVKEQIKIYVVGCVKDPGIVTLEKGQLIDDAVQKAGGLTVEADAGSINMVYELNDNTMLYIRSKKDLNSNQTAGSPATVSRNTAESSKLGKGAVIVSDSGGSAEVVASGESYSSKESNVNINTADAGELDTLPGVGEATARDIITFREKNGPFRKIEDIMKVPRIKQNRFDSVKEFISVD